MQRPKIDGERYRLESLLYGGDYNPSQWPAETRREDMRLMKAAGVNCVSLAVFAWAALQSADEGYHFEWLDEIINMLHEAGIGVNLATATAAQPAWLSRAYDDVLPTDERGNRVWYGSRQSYCPHSLNYRAYAAALVARMAERYGAHPALMMWHVNNEYGCHVSSCYCDRCAAAFRTWLRSRYATLARLNEAWGTTFWSQHYYDWEEIIPPRQSSAQRNPALELDYHRFSSDSLLELFRMEAEILRAITPHIPLTTNFTPRIRPVNLFKWAREMDYLAWDNYPDPTLGTKEVDSPMLHDLMRGFSRGAPFLLLEQAASQVNWRQVNTPKPAGTMRLWSYQAVARGADAVMFFQWRQSRKGAEKFHSGMIDYTGNEHSRTHQEVKRLGGELRKLHTLTGTRTRAQCAIIFDYDSWWAVEYRPGPSENLQYWEVVKRFYRALWERNITVDFVEQGADLAGYALVVAPLLYIMHADTAPKLERYVRDGGNLLVSFFSGVADEDDALSEGGAPGPLADLLGLRVEEYSPLPEGNRITLKPSSDWAADLAPDQTAAPYSCDLWLDVVKVAKAGSAEVLAVVKDGDYRDAPALTRNRVGNGRAYYLAAMPERESMGHLMEKMVASAGVTQALPVPPGVEVVERGTEQGVIFVLNHNTHTEKIPLVDGDGVDGDGEWIDLLTGRILRKSVEVASRGVLALQRRNN